VSADRELAAEVTVAAPAARVWQVLTDFRNLAAASPELMAMTPLKPGGLREGQWYVGWNRRKAAVWPTRNVVAEVVLNQRLVWDTTSSGARWIYQLAPIGDHTRLSLRRPVPRRLTSMSGLFATAFLGGAQSHADELEAGMRTTLEHLRSVAER
jgi:uncharacterized protein YndB with AHSA1/START domain